MSVAFDLEQVKFLEKQSWPFLEAYRILNNIKYKIPDKGYVLFETGYGPSGLPHIGTFGEVVRTTMVMKAFNVLSDIPTKLLCVSDDIDAMRKVPDTIPNKREYEKYIGLPLTSIPDPFGTHESYGHHMNARLIKFLDHFEFKYEFVSATDCYKRGIFNKELLKVLEHYDEIMDIMLPTLGKERQSTYSPFLPICRESGHVLQVKVVDKNLSRGEIAYHDPQTKKLIWTKVTDGQCKLQWKPDFGMRWAAFDVDFEMYGKEHYTNGAIYTSICKVLGGKSPVQSFYELFLDEKGEKISKSKGNGLTIDEWLKYAPKESLSLFMYVSPKKAKRLHFDVIPKFVDDYIRYLNQYLNESDLIKKFTNPVFHIHGENVPNYDLSDTNLNYSLLLNLVSTCGTDNKDVIWGYLRKSVKYCNSSIEENHLVQSMILGAINYYHDFVKNKKIYRTPNQFESSALKSIVERLKTLPENLYCDDNYIQNILYEIGKSYNFDMKEWFKSLYEILLGTPSGPRFGSFIALFGVKEIIELIEQKINT